MKDLYTDGKDTAITFDRGNYNQTQLNAMSVKFYDGVTKTLYNSRRNYCYVIWYCVDYDPYINETDYFPNGFDGTGRVFYHISGYILYNHELCVNTGTYWQLYGGFSGNVTQAKHPNGTGYNRNYYIIIWYCIACDFSKGSTYSYGMNSSMTWLYEYGIIDFNIEYDPNSAIGTYSGNYAEKFNSPGNGAYYRNFRAKFIIVR